ncbi:glycosyltransferase [Helicobacter sp. 11S02629-2]|uniref:glycosyltransferase family 2 protein n=1 Tax=Helicobacter sp. 11S02629-2 TaxID=1476195 RepID=UPI000BA53E6A|nr:glycosyltransferase [Helicobacter sp. 11S02629-2]PAF44637.1 hypothetical protein BKH40_05260 [Helicobacter sp. 11S02629-2]
MAKLSIIIPVFNVEKYLKECLDSCLCEDVTNFEVIVIDDGSSDTSLDIAKDYAKKYQNILVVTKPNAGLSSARNAGLELLEGLPLRKILDNLDTNQKIQNLEGFIPIATKANKTKPSFDIHPDASAYFERLESNIYKTNIANFNDISLSKLPSDNIVHFLDSDDYFINDALKTTLEAFKDPNLDLLWHDFSVILDDGITGITWYNSHELALLKTLTSKINMTNVEVLSHILTGWFWWSWGGAFKASVLNPYALRFNHSVEFEDNDFGPIIFGLAKNIHIDYNPRMIYRIRNNSITRSYTRPKVVPDYLAAIESNFETYTEAKVYYRAYSFFKLCLNVYNFQEAFIPETSPLKDNYKKCMQAILLGAFELASMQSLKKSDPLNALELFEFLSKACNFAPSMSQNLNNSLKRKITSKSKNARTVLESLSQIKQLTRAYVGGMLKVPLIRKFLKMIVPSFIRKGLKKLLKIA